jgi:hypothetical protein
MVYLHRNSEGMGPYGPPGPSYGLRVVTDANNGIDTSISPMFEVLKDLKDLDIHGGPDALGVTPDDLLRNVLLTQTAQKIDTDIVVSDAITVERYDIPSNHQANVFTPSRAFMTSVARYPCSSSSSRRPSPCWQPGQGPT